MVAIDFTRFLDVVPNVIKGRYSIFIRGPHGIGKSSLVYQMAPHISKWLELEDKDFVYPIVERRASQMADVGDLMGLPFEKGPTTTFKPMDWFYRACDGPCLLYFDEIDRGQDDVRQAIFELNDSRKIAGHYLHPDTIVIAAGNSGPQDDNIYKVGEMEPAELDRWWAVDVDPTIEEWFEWIANPGESRKDARGMPIGPFHPLIFDFLQSNKESIEHRDQYEPNKVYPSRRSWDRLDHVFKFNDLLSKPYTLVGGERVERPEIAAISGGFVGEEAAISLQQYAKNYDRNLTVDDILVHGKIARARLLEQSDHMAMIEKICDSNHAKDGFKGEILENFCRYLMVLPEEDALYLWEGVTGPKCNPEKNGRAIHSSVVDGKSMSKFIAKLSGSELEKR